MNRFAVIFAAVLIACASLVGAKSPASPSKNPSVQIQPGLRSRALLSKPENVRIDSRAKIEAVIVKLAEGTRPRLSSKTISSLSGKNLSSLNALLADKPTGNISPLLSASPQELEKRKTLLECRSGQILADWNTYFSIAVASPGEAEELVNRLNRLPEVEIAYAQPEPEPATDLDPPTPDFNGNQVHLDVAPGGVDARYGWTITGGDGAGIKIIDVEGGWTFNHEDLELDPAILLGGVNSNDQAWWNHGSAVLGEIKGENNGYGITGIAPAADLAVVSHIGLGTTEAILLAIDHLNPGDILLIEIHSPGPRYDFQPRSDQLGYVCVEYWPGPFDALQYAWAKGIIVVEASGNGGEYLADPIYENRFDTAVRNSHAILVGAGAPPSGNFGSDRSCISFSNYGQRVNLQGQGAEVVTCGYGALFNGNSDRRQYYTNAFNGTSSATPIVAGSAAAVQGIYKSRNNGAVLDSDRLRDLLIATGSPQQGSLFYHIGPRPDIRAAEQNLPAPYGLTVAPGLLDTSITFGDQITVTAALTNISTDRSLAYTVEINPSGEYTFSPNWLSLPEASGTIPPQESREIDLILEASVLDGQLISYKGLVEIEFGEEGGAPDGKLFLPVFMEVICSDTSYIPSALFSPETFNWIDISSTGTRIQSYMWHNSYTTVDLRDDGTAGPFNLGFDFHFFDTVYSRIYIGVNGAVSFTDYDVNYEGFFDNLVIPGAPFTSIVAPFWNDLNMEPSIGGHGNVYYYRSPARDTFIVQYDRIGNFNSLSDTMTTFEIILVEDGTITFQYLSVGQTGLKESAVIGIAGQGCYAQPFVSGGLPAEHVVADSTAVVFDYNLIIWEMAGDANDDGEVNVGDAVYLINWIFKGGATPIDMREADVNCDGDGNVGDAVYLINYTFRGGAWPCWYIRF